MSNQNSGQKRVFLPYGSHPTRDVIIEIECVRFTKSFLGKIALRSAVFFTYAHRFAFTVVGPFNGPTNIRSQYPSAPNNGTNNAQEITNSFIAAELHGSWSIATTVSGLCPTNRSSSTVRSRLPSRSPAHLYTRSTMGSTLFWIHCRRGRTGCSAKSWSAIDSQRISEAVMLYTYRSPSLAMASGRTRS